MNVNPGGKQSVMRPGWFVRNGVRFRQHMVFEGGQYEGLPKGLRQVCLERFGAEAITGEYRQTTVIKIVYTHSSFLCVLIFHIGRYEAR